MRKYSAFRILIAISWHRNLFWYKYYKCITKFFSDEGRFHDTLKKVELGLVPNDECQQRLRLTRLQKYFKLDPSFICAGGVQGADTCKVPPNLIIQIRHHLFL